MYGMDASAASHLLYSYDADLSAPVAPAPYGAYGHFSAAPAPMNYFDPSGYYANNGFGATHSFPVPPQFSTAPPTSYNMDQATPSIQHVGTFAIRAALEAPRQILAPEDPNSASSNSQVSKKPPGIKRKADKKSKPKRSKQSLEDRRKNGTIRQRARVGRIKAGFKKLQDSIFKFPPSSVSQEAILAEACQYIRKLEEKLGAEEENAVREAHNQEFDKRRKGAPNRALSAPESPYDDVESEDEDFLLHQGENDGMVSHENMDDSHPYPSNNLVDQENYFPPY